MQPAPAWVDWDAARTHYRAQLSETSDQRALWTVATGLLATLNDVHLRLTSGFGSWSGSVTEEWLRLHPPDFSLDVVDTKYFGGALRSSPDGRLRFGMLTARIGYIHISDFGGSDWGFVDQVGATLQSSEALIIDVRNNPGGNDANGRDIAGHFADQRRLFRLIRTRNGPEHDDFSAPIEDHIDPSGAHFPGLVAVLTNRRVASSAEGFVLMMRVLPQVVVVGDTTGGASANPRPVTLPNGWVAQISQWWVQTPDGFTFEDVGLPPNVPVKLAPADQASGTDTVLERALAILQAPP